MIAALANLDYNNYEIHWAVTGGFDDSTFHEFRDRLSRLMQAVKWKEDVSWTVHYVPLPKEMRFKNFEPVLRNKSILRDTFLDSDCDYFLLLGGDNPPPRTAIKKLLKVKADVAIAVCYQRPGVDNVDGVYPLVWRYMWLPNELDKLKNLDPANREQMRMAWLHCPNILSVSFDAGWKRKKILWGICGGDGCALIRRPVLEMIDWGVTPDQAYHSEDVHFMSTAIWYGFSTACLTTLHCPHLSPNGEVV